MLKITDLNVYYGGIHALSDVTIEVNEGEIVTLVGANGAGKTSTLRAISGLVPIAGGKIEFEGKDLSKVAPNRIPYLGISHVPEGRRIFANMTVQENLELGAYCRKDKAEIRRDYEAVLEKFPRLRERMKQRAGTLSGGTSAPGPWRASAAPRRSCGRFAVLTQAKPFPRCGGN